MEKQIKTVGGYLVEGFKRIKNPPKLNICSTQLMYEGFAVIPMRNDKLERTYISWDIEGKVNNPKRWHDCNIDITKIGKDERQ